MLDQFQSKLDTNVPPAATVIPNIPSPPVQTAETDVQYMGTQNFQNSYYPQPVRGGDQIELSFTVKTDTGITRENFHILIRDSFNEHWAYFLFGFIFFLAAAFLAKYVKQRYCRIYPPATSELVFQFSSNSKSVVIPIKQFNKLPVDLKMKYSRKLTSLSIQGTINPTLNYRWKAKIVDKITLLETVLPVCLTLSMWSTWN